MNHIRRTQDFITIGTDLSLLKKRIIATFLAFENKMFFDATIAEKFICRRFAATSFTNMLLTRRTNF